MHASIADMLPTPSSFRVGKLSIDPREQGSNLNAFYHSTCFRTWGHRTARRQPQRWAPPPKSLGGQGELRPRERQGPKQGYPGPHLALCAARAVRGPASVGGVLATPTSGPSRVGGGILPAARGHRPQTAPSVAGRGPRPCRPASPRRTVVPGETERSALKPETRPPKGASGRRQHRSAGGKVTRGSPGGGRSSRRGRRAYELREDALATGARWRKESRTDALADEAAGQTSWRGRSSRISRLPPLSSRDHPLGN